MKSHDEVRKEVYTPRKELTLGWGMESNTSGGLSRKDRVTGKVRFERQRYSKMNRVWEQGEIKDIH